MQTPQELLDALFPVILGMFFAICRLLIERRTEIVQWVTGLIVGAGVSYITYLYLRDSQVTEGTQAIIIGLSGLLSHDFLKGLLLIGRWWREDPKGIIRWIRGGMK